MLTLPGGNCNGYNLASGIQYLLNANEINFTFEVVYNTATGTTKIEETSESSGNSFDVPSDFGIIDWCYNHSEYPWRNTDETIVYPDNNNRHYINDILRHTESNPVRLSYMYKTYASNFLDLLNIHNSDMHCPNLGHVSSIGVRGEHRIIKKIPVSSGIGYLIIDSVVSPHDKMDDSRQRIEPIQINLKYVSGNAINLHGANCSFSLVFVTSE